MSDDSYEGIPRDKIPWGAKNQLSKMRFLWKVCGFLSQAFRFEKSNGAKKTVVKNQNACIVFCRGCEDICPASAITHPSEVKTQEIIDKLKAKV